MSEGRPAPLQQPAVKPPVSVRLEGDILFVTLSRPEKRNALNSEAIGALERTFAAPPAGARVAVISGEGDHFSAGLDLSDLSDGGEDDVMAGIAHSMMWHHAFQYIERGRLPVVSALKGAVVGGGLELAAATHVRVAEENTFYALPEGQRGIFVGGGGSVRIPRLIGTARMADMMLTGRTYDAAGGMAAGLSQYVVPAGTGLAKATELARAIAGNAPMTNFAVVQALPRIAETDAPAGFLMEALMSAIAQNDAEAKARMRAFLDKKAAKVRAPG